MTASTPLGPRSKKLPSFGEFIKASPYAKRFDDAVGGATGFAFVASLAAGYGLYQWLGWVGIVATVLIVFPFVVSVAEKVAKKRKKIDEAAERRYNQLHDVMVRLRGYLDAGKLHRYLEPVAAALLEESARNWKRIHEALEGPGWSHANLPAHYSGIREQAKMAADHGMEDLVILLKSSIRSQPKTEDWHVAFSRFIGEIVGVNLDSTEETATFPVEYEPARDIASKLSRLAEDIESTSRKLLREDFVRDRFSSPTSIDAVLGELRAIDVAETELGSDLHAR